MTTRPQRMRLHLRLRDAAVIIVAAGAAFAVVPGTRATQSDPDERQAGISKAVDATIQKQVSQRMTGNFRPSLDMRENVDFLLTPALLVQEAMSDDVVITYPTE